MIRKGPILVGAVGAVVVAVVLTLLPREFARGILVVLVGYFGGVYFGIGLSARRQRDVVLQDGVSVVFFGLALAGLWVSPLFLALACFAHAAWDVTTGHPRALGASIAPWYVPLCASFDILLGVFILAWWW